MKNYLEYKDYYGSVSYSTEDDVLYGKILGISDSISYEGQSIEEIREAFVEAVEDYFLLCEEVGKEPERLYKGSFNIRIAPELHKKAVIHATASGDTLNHLVEQAIEQYVANG